MKKLLFTITLLLPCMLLAQLPKKVWVEDVKSNSEDNKYSNDKVATEMGSIVSTSLKKNIKGTEKAQSDIILVLKNDGTFAAYDLQTKQPKWSYTFTDESNDETRSRLRYEKGIVYAIGRYHQLVALDVNDGSVYWDNCIGQNGKEGLEFHNSGQHLPIFNDLIYVACNNRNIYAFYKKTGNMKWNYRLDFPFNIYSPIVCEITNRLVINNAPWVYCFNATTGQPLWQRGFGSEAMYALGQIDYAHAYMSGDKGILYALNVDNNANIDWQVDCGSSLGDNTILDDETLYIAIKKHSSSPVQVKALNTEDGSALWTTNIDGEKYKEVENFCKIEDYIAGVSANELFLIKAKDGTLLTIPQPKETPISNIIKYGTNEIAFLTEHFFVIFDWNTKTFKYDDISLSLSDKNKKAIYFCLALANK